MVRLLLRIHRAVAGSESWYAAWQAVKAELREHWPAALPSIGSAVAIMWTWLEGLMLPLAIIAGLVAFAALYVVRFYSGRQGEARPYHPVQHTPDMEPAATSSTPDDVGDELRRVRQAIKKQADFTTELVAESAQTQEAKLNVYRYKNVEPRLHGLKQQNDCIESDVRRLLDWVRYLSLAQTEACRALFVRSIQVEAPALPTMGEKAAPEEIVKFIDEVNQYNESVREAAFEWRLWDCGEFNSSINEAEHSGETAFCEAHRDRNLTAEDFARRRRYAIAVAKLKVAQNFLGRRGSLAETFQMQALPGLQSAADLDHVKSNDESSSNTLS